MTDRSEQARREVGHTEVSRPTARALLTLVGLAVLVPPVVQTMRDLAVGRGPLPALAPLVAALREVPAAADPLIFNRSFLAAIDAAEDRLEEESWLRQRLLPPTQELLTGVFGLGNEQAVAGDDGWWFLAADFAHATGRGFLDPAVLRRRWREEGVSPDPLPALAGFAEDLERRGIELLVVPVPAKPTIVPQPLATRPVAPPVQNPSFSLLLERLRVAGIEFYDPVGDLVALQTSGEKAYLQTDTHWTPAGLERVAQAVAENLRRRGFETDRLEYYRRSVAVDGRGDLVAMLELPAASRRVARERVEVQRVLTAEGQPWKPSSDAAVLLLGDSFTNVYSQPGLGWGGGAGLAEQLAFHLGAAVDRLARNAGGADQLRAELAAELASGRDRLAGKRFVVYQFASRELSAGDWRPIALPPVAGSGL